MLGDLLAKYQDWPGADEISKRLRARAVAMGIAEPEEGEQPPQPQPDPNMLLAQAEMAKAQASGDLVTLAERGRRVVHLHLPDNSGVTLRQLAEVISDILETMTVPTA